MRLARLIILLLIAVELRAGEVSSAQTSTAKQEPTWHLSVVTSPTDGSQAVVATLPAAAPIRSGFGEVTPVLTLRYRAGRASAYVGFDAYLGEADLEASVAFGDAPPEGQRWKVSEDRRTAFVPGDPLAFVNRLKQAGTFSVTIDPRGKGPVTARFVATDVDQVIKALISAGVKYTR